MTTTNPLVITTEFQPRIPAGSNRSRTTKRQARNIVFIGVDGEGVNLLSPDGTKSHRYVMLSVGDVTLWENGRELTHQDIFPFLWEQHLANPGVAFVGFFLGYDFAMWLKSLPESRARALFTAEGIKSRKKYVNPMPFPVEVDGEWEIDILGMKRFMLRPSVPQGTKNPNEWMYICDTGSYFQAAFLTVCNPDQWPDGHKPCTTEEYARIKKGKDSRADEFSDGDLSYYPDMVKYNGLENRVLGSMMATLNQGFVQSGVRLKRKNFYGPGQAIQEWLNQKVAAGKFLAHKDMETSVPRYALEAGWESYYGGRFELFYHGHVPGESYEYDITSAYPHAMRNLPCLCSDTWREGEGTNIPDHTLAFVYGTFTGSAPMVGALPNRTEKGSIIYPHVTRGWYVLSEVNAAVKAGLIDGVHIENWVTYKRTCGHAPPLAELADLFAQRLRVDKKSPHGKAIKLMLNSAYGKFAQSIGTPKYGNSIYASLITSVCRTMILDAIGSHPTGKEDVLMIATDGIYFRTPHPNLTISKDVLGDWEMETKQNLTLMKPGVYWDDKARKYGASKIKSRGISAKTLADNIPKMDAKFTRLQQGEYGFAIEPRFMPRININVSFSVTSPKLALARGKWNTAAEVVWDMPQTQSANVEPKRKEISWDGIYLTSAPGMAEEIESHPYNKRFGFGETELPLFNWGMFTQDGTAEDDYINYLLKEMNQ